MTKRQGSREYPAEVKNRVGQNLLTAKHGDQVTVASCLKVTTRTLRSWKAQAKARQPPRPRGRKKQDVTLGELIVIGREWKRQGYVGSRPVIAALPAIRVRVVRTVVSGLKKRRQARRLAHQRAARVSVRVHRPGTLTVMDAAKIPNKKRGEAIVCKDRGSLMITVTEAAGVATKSVDTLGVFEEMRSQNRLPLVVGSDNGSPFTALAVEDFLRENKIIHLRSLPRVPQQNGAAENAVGDYKNLSGGGKAATHVTQILNHCRKRETLNWRTPAEYDREHFQPYTQKQRETFYTAASAAIKAAKRGAVTAYEKRKAEREAIFATMESFGLITRTRGHRRA